MLIFVLLSSSSASPFISFNLFSSSSCGSAPPPNFHHSLFSTLTVCCNISQPLPISIVLSFFLLQSLFSFSLLFLLFELTCSPLLLLSLLFCRHSSKHPLSCIQFFFFSLFASTSLLIIIFSSFSCNTCHSSLLSLLHPSFDFST